MPMKQFHTIVIVISLSLTLSFFTSFAAEFLKSADTGENSCFCKLGGEVDDCSCTVESVDTFNNKHIYQKLSNLLEKDFFKFYHVDLQAPCKFWKPEGHCMLQHCGVKPCSEDEVPDGLKNGSGEEQVQPHAETATPAKKYSKAAQLSGCDTADETEVKLSKIDKTISDESNEAFKTWTRHDESQNYFCELDDETSPTLEYVNLLLNPERFTGYAGPHAIKIWNSIYNENCFNDRNPEDPSYGLHAATMCLEKRAFYRMVSGLHTSINTHLSARYFYPRQNAFGKDEWNMNAEEFYTRFDPQNTNKQGPLRLRNLYFTYLVELRALAKVAPYLKNQLFYTGEDAVDRETNLSIAELLDTIIKFPHHFDESKLFQGEASQLKEEFRLKFLNISRIMDCVGCDKCRLWGKLQVRGMGTALKILFSGDNMGPDSLVTASNNNMFHLNRVEIVSLFNAFGKLSTSIKYIEDFRRLVP